MSDTTFPYNETTNLGFVTNPNIQDSALKATDRREQWLLGAYHYANSDRDETSRNASAAIFGKGTIPLDDKENSAYFLGDAMLRESGYTGSPLEYFFRQKKELPAGVNDEDSARIYLGNQLLAEMRDMYDRNIATSNETLANIDGLLDGTLKPETLTEEQLENIEATGYTLKDLVTARQALEYTERGILDKLGQSFVDTAEGIADNITGGALDALKAIEIIESGGDQMLEELGSVYKHRWDTALASASAPWRAFSDNLGLADIIRTYDGDKQVVLSLIADRLRRKAAQEYKDGNMGTRLLDVLKSEITKHAESIAMLSPENVLQSDNVSDAINAHARRASYLTFISDAIEQGRAEAMEEQGGQNWLEGGTEFGIHLLSFVNKAGLISSAIRFAQEGYGRALNALSDEQANLPDASSDELAQAAAKGAAVGAITVATRGISTRLAGRTFAKLAPKASATWGTAITSRYAGALAAEWGMSTLNFGLVLPLLDGGANAVFDAVTPFDSRLDTGVQALEQLWKDIRDLDYWGSLGTAALLWSAGGAYRTSRNSLASSRLNDIYRVNGLRESSITEAQSIPNLPERAAAMDKALTKQRKENPGATIKLALKQAKRIKDKAQQEAARKKAQESQQDEAAKATLQLYGVSAENSSDPAKVDIYTGGKYNETTKQFERGNTKVTLSREDAELYLGSLMNNSFSALTERVRNAYGSDKLMDELKKLYGDRITLETILSPEMLDRVRSRAKEAEAKVNERTKELIESTKDAEGKPTLSEAEARKRALAEVHPSIDKTRSMAELIKFGEDLEKRAEIERSRNEQDKTKMPIGSRAFVLSLPRKMGEAIRRILRYTKNVTTREIAEEYGEIYLEDYIASTGESYTDTWRTLQLFHDSMKGEAPTLTTLTQNYPDLAQKVKDGAADADLSPVEMNNLRKDVREAMSLLLISDLRSKAQDGQISIPVWARPLFDVNLRARQRMEAELAFATAINEARQYGMADEAAMRLLNASAKEIERALAAIETPTESDFYKTFQDWNQRFAEAEMRLDGLSIEQLHEFETRIAQEEQQFAEEEAAQEEKRTAPIREAIAEMEAEGSSHEEAVRIVNERFIDSKEKDIEANPFAQKDDAFANRTCIEITDGDGIICYSGIVNVADLKILTNFKINADAETGEVHKLTGDYFADHDPIRVFQATDGTLTVISGRHRLAHAKRNGATKIAAYIYKESPQQDKKWAQRRDIEWNIRDNQATPLEVALFIRGELIEGIPALTPAEMERSGMTRRGTQAYKGYIIGTKASDDVIGALRNGLIKTEQAIWIAQFDSNPQVQLKGLEAALNKETKENIQLSMNIEKGRLEIMSDLGLMDMEDMFGNLIQNAKLQEFTDKYTKEKIANLNARNTYLSQNSRKKSDVFAKEYEITVNNPELLKAEKNKIAELRVKWQTPYLHPELREEIKEAFKEAYPEEWAKMERESTKNDSPPPVEDSLPLFPSDASLNFSVIGEHAQTWEKYVKEGRTFTGRDDGKLRAELDSSVFELLDPDVRGLPISDKYKTERAEAALLSVLKKIYNNKIFSQDDIKFELYFGVDKNIPGVYANPGKIVEFVLSNETLDLDKAKTFIRNNKPYSLDKNSGNVWRLEDIFEASELYEAYPQLKEILVSEYAFSGRDADLSGKVDGKIIHLNANEAKEEKQKTILHEVQHVIQSIEGFARGSNTTLSYSDFKKAYREIEKRYRAFLRRNSPSESETKAGQNIARILEAYKRLDKQYKANPNSFQRFLHDAARDLGIRRHFLYVDNVDLYNLSAGEAEARAVESRAYYAENERKRKPFNESLDIPHEEAIVILSDTGYRNNEGQNVDIASDFSIIGDHLQLWERDPDAELGELGSFGKNIEGKLQDIGEKVFDNRVTTMRNALRRRQIELQHIKKGSNDNAQKLFGEMAAIVNQLTSLLPTGYRFGLDPYIEFLTVYADLYGKGEPERAGAALPMADWPQIMASSFKKQVERILSDRLKPEDEVFFHELFNEAAVRIDLAGIYKELQATRRRYVDEVKARWSKTPLDSVAAKQAFEAEKKIARQEAFDDIQAKYAEEFATAYKAIGEMRAHRLMDKFLARVIKKLDNHRKDRILGRILRAVNGLTPRKEKNGKPVHGRVEKAIHDKAVDYVRLLQLTESEKNIIDQQYADMAQMTPDTPIEVTTYDKEGAEVTIKTTVHEYNTYAGYETMSVEQAEAAAESLGTFVKEGKTAWQAAEARANQEAEKFCAPMYEKWSETESQRKARLEKHNLKIWAKNKILNTIVDWFNDSQFFNVCGSVDGFEPLADLTLRIASAHTYLETAEKENHDWAYNSLDTILKLEGKTKREAAKAKRAFMTHIKTNKKCDIVLTTQAPDFAAQHQAALRRSLLKRLFAITRQKNFSVNKFAAAIRYIADEKLMPPELVMEVQDKYGHIGEADKYGKGDFHAYRQYFGTEKFTHLLNINQSIKDRTAKSLDEWKNGKKNEAGEYIKQPANIADTHITEITPDQAAYRVLMTEQADYADMLRRQGYTPEVVNQLREIAGEQMMQYAYTLRERMNARTDIIKAIYEQTFGLPFPVVENYFRAYFDVGNVGKKDASLTDLDLGIGAGEGVIEIFYTRQKHNAHISPTMDVSTAYALGVKQQDNLIAYSDPKTHQHLGLFLRKIMANSKNGVRLSDVISNGLGPEALAAMRKHTDNMFRIFRQSEKTSQVLTRLFADIGSASAIATISGKFSSLLKNSMALFNTLGGSDKAGALAWYSSLGKVLTGNGKITPEQIMLEPVIRDRFKGWDYDADKAALHNLTGETAEHGATDAAPRYGMAAFGAIDRYMTARSAAVLYDAVYRKLQRENKEMEHDMLHTLSMDEVAKALGMKGQPLDFRQRALNASRIDWRTMGSYFLGGESWNTFTNCMRLWAKTNVHGKEGKQKILEASAVWLTQGAMMSLLNWGYYALTDDEEHWEKRNFMFHMLVGTAAGPISGMPVISNLAAGGLNTVGRMAGWNNMPYIGTPGFFPLVDIFRVIPPLKKAFLNDKLNWWDRAIIVNDVVRAASFVAMTTNMRPTSKARAATLAAGIWGSAISNGIDFVLRLGRASDERFFNFEDDSNSDND